MSLRLKAAEICVPPVVRARRFRDLVELTAKAFLASPPDLRGLSFKESRRAYARFTHEQAGRFLEDGPRRIEAKRRLREASFEFGQKLRRDLGLRSKAQAMRAGRLLYRLIGIDFQGNESGDIVIDRCFFADEYSPRTCDLISALDEGLLAGFSGGGTLVFAERITEKRPCCRARFHFPEALR